MNVNIFLINDWNNWFLKLLSMNLSFYESTNSFSASKCSTVFRLGQLIPLCSPTWLGVEFTHCPITKGRYQGTWWLFFTQVWSMRHFRPFASVKLLSRSCMFPTGGNVSTPFFFFCCWMSCVFKCRLACDPCMSWSEGKTHHAYSQQHVC